MLAASRGPASRPISTSAGIDSSPISASTPAPSEDMAARFGSWPKSPSGGFQASTKMISEASPISGQIRRSISGFRSRICRASSLASRSGVAISSAMSGQPAGEGQEDFEHGCGFPDLDDRYSGLVNGRAGTAPMIVKYRALRHENQGL